MFNRARRIIRVIATTVLLLAAAVAVFGLWEHYMVAPWTRDGQVRVQVANIAPQVAGQITELRVGDNQFVHRGDLLYVIDKVDYKIALDMADADVASKKADLDVKQQQSARRQQLTTLSTSVEEKQQFSGQFEVAQGAYQTALANQEKARVNLQRTNVRSTVNGYVTNLLLRVGDYANVGSPNVAVVDSDSYWVTGYFEETKMGSFAVGDPARVELMGYRAPLDGHVDSITRGIATANATVSTQGLPSVQAVYTWVRLAQRIPVRIKIDRVPPDVALAAGMTATVVVTPAQVRQPTLWDGMRRQFSNLTARGSAGGVTQTTQRDPETAAQVDRHGMGESQATGTGAEPRHDAAPSAQNKDAQPSYAARSVDDGGALKKDGDPAVAAPGAGQEAQGEKARQGPVGVAGPRVLSRQDGVRRGSRVSPAARQSARRRRSRKSHR